MHWTQTAVWAIVKKKFKLISMDPIEKREIAVYETKINKIAEVISRVDCSVALEWILCGRWERVGTSPNFARWGTWSFACSSRRADEVSGYRGGAVLDWNTQCTRGYE